MLKKTNSFYCKECGSIQTYPLELQVEKNNFCPVCLAKEKHYKMYKVLIEE